MIKDAFGNGEMLDHFNTFTEYFKFFDEMVQSTVHSSVIENLINRFFNELLLDKVQPVLLKAEDEVEVRTCLQYLVHMVHLSKWYKVTEAIYFFLFGFPEGYKPPYEEEIWKDDINEENNDLYNAERIDTVDQIWDEELVVLDEDQQILIDAIEDDLSEEEVLEDFKESQTRVIRIGNQVISGPKQNPVQEVEPRESRGRAKNTGGKKRGRSVSVLKIKDAKIELDLLSSLLNEVENAEKQVENEINNNEQTDFECKIKVSKHEVREITRSIMIAIISDEEYNSTVCLKLIEVFLKKQNEVILDGMIYKWMKYFSEGEDGIDVSRYFEYLLGEEEVERDEFVIGDEVTIYSKEKARRLGVGDYFDKDPFRTSELEVPVLTELSSLPASSPSTSIEAFNSRLSLILLTLNPKHDYFYPSEDPLESGLLFATLLKKLSFLLTNPRIDNLILTSIWLTICELPLNKAKPETFYLFAFWFQVWKNKKDGATLGLFDTIEGIQREVGNQQREDNDELGLGK